MMMHTTLAQLRTLKLDGLAAGLEEQLAQPGLAALSFEERFALLVDREVHCRNDRKLLRLLKNAHLKYGQAAIEDIDIFAAPGRPVPINLDTFSCFIDNRNGRVYIYIKVT